MIIREITRRKSIDGREGIFTTMLTLSDSTHGDMDILKWQWRRDLQEQFDFIKGVFLRHEREKLNYYNSEVMLDIIYKIWKSDQRRGVDREVKGLILAFLQETIFYAVKNKFEMYDGQIKNPSWSFASIFIESTSEIYYKVIPNFDPNKGRITGWCRRGVDSYINDSYLKPEGISTMTPPGELVNSNPVNLRKSLESVGKYTDKEVAEKLTAFKCWREFLTSQTLIGRIDIREEVWINAAELYNSICSGNDKKTVEEFKKCLLIDCVDAIRFYKRAKKILNH
jgi:hypothetical protein